MNIMSHIGQPSMWVHLSYNSRNGMRLSYIAANSKPIPGLELKTRNFGGKIDVIYLGSTLMHFVHLLKLYLSLRLWGYHYLVEMIQHPAFGGNKVLLFYNMYSCRHGFPGQATETHMFSSTLDQLIEAGLRITMVTMIPMA